MQFLLLLLILFTIQVHSATIAIIDTGFDLDHDFLKPKVLKRETDEEIIDPELNKKFHGWNFHDNSHLKRPVIQDQTTLQEILLYRNLKAKGHREGLTPDEFEWYSKRKMDPTFKSKVKEFKKHAHGTIVAGIALREGENINIFPIRGLHIDVPVVAVDNPNSSTATPSIAAGKNPQEKFDQEIKNSLNRVSQKFSKICNYLSLKKIEVVNASYGITYKNIVSKFREMHKEILKTDIDETNLKARVDKYFEELYARGEKTMKRYPNMLFIFSAGNSGLDNDQYHHYPSRIKISNAITVAAINGEYLASFSNYGKNHVDIGAPGVAILSLLPKVYSQDGHNLYSPSSGTSMAAPYISNLAAQIMNTNPKLKPSEVKKIILETGDEKPHLTHKLLSGAIVSNNNAIKAALLSKDMPLQDAINLSKLNLIPMEDKISIGLSPAVAAPEIHKKVMNSIPSTLYPEDDDIDEDPTITEEKVAIPTTKSSSLPLMDQEKEQPGKSAPLPSAPEVHPQKSADPVPSSQSEGQSPQPSSERPASSFEPQSSPPEAQSPTSAPSLPQS